MMTVSTAEDVLGRIANKYSEFDAEVQVCRPEGAAKGTGFPTLLVPEYVSAQVALDVVALSRSMQGDANFVGEMSRDQSWRAQRIMTPDGRFCAGIYHSQAYYDERDIEGSDRLEGIPELSKPAPPEPYPPKEWLE